MQPSLSYSDIPLVNVGTFMMQKMKQFGEHIATVDGATGKSYTFNDVINRSERLAAGLQKLGVKKGDVVCILAENHVDYPTSFYGVSLVTAILQPLNPLYTTDDLKRVFKDCQTKFVITQPELVPRVKDAVTVNPDIKVISFGKADGCVSFDSLLDPRHGRYVTPDCDPKTTAVAYLSSSGTTGFPKSVQLSHFAVVANIIQLEYARHSTIPTPAHTESYNELAGVSESVMLFLPMFHIYGLTILSVFPHSQGAKLVVMARFNLDELLRLVSEHKPTRLYVVPPVMVLLAKSPDLSKYDLSSLETMTCGAAPLSDEIESIVKKRLNLKSIMQGFGMTEIGVSHSNSQLSNRHNSVGKLLPLVEMKVVDVDTGKTLGRNQRGELWVRGPSTAMGYLNRPRETADMFLADGWVRTGDIVYEDDEGFVFIVDRLKELIKYKGFQVAPATLEDILLRNTKIADVAVLGVPDDEAGELPKAFVVKRPGSDITEAEIIKFVEGQVAPHMRLRGGVEFISEIPRSLAGKILRRVLREQVKTKSKL